MVVVIDGVMVVVIVSAFDETGSRNANETAIATGIAMKKD